MVYQSVMMRRVEVTVFIEIVPRDTVKYEVDKETGYLKIDRPQQYSNVVPANYGFIPQTYCSETIANLARAKLPFQSSEVMVIHWTFSY